MTVVVDELRELGAEVHVIDARDIVLSFPGQPETADARHIRTIVKDAGGVVIASPEYHGSYAAMTKLVIENLGFPSALAGKPVALLGVAGGRIGAIKTLEQLRGVCAHIGAIVIPGAVSIAGVRAVFDAQGNIVDAGSEKALRGLADAMVSFMRDYVCPKYTLEAMVREEGVPWTATV
jgi:NAD(P)H-dependent FMN reductase